MLGEFRSNRVLTHTDTRSLFKMLYLIVYIFNIQKLQKNKKIQKKLNENRTHGALAHKNLQLKTNGFHEHSAYDFETENAKYQIIPLCRNYQQIVRQKKIVIK